MNSYISLGFWLVDDHLKGKITNKTTLSTVSLPIQMPSSSSKCNCHEQHFLTASSSALHVTALCWMKVTLTLNSLCSRSHGDTALNEYSPRSIQGSSLHHQVEPVLHYCLVFCTICMHTSGIYSTHLSPSQWNHNLEQHLPIKNKVQ